MKKRTVKILKIIAVILVVLSLIYAVAAGVSASKLRRAYTDLKNDNRPIRKKDVIPTEVPDVENAALLYESATLLLKAQPAPNGNLLEHLGKLSDKFIKESIEPDEFIELQQLIEQDVVSQALSLVEQGTRRRSCRFDYDYNSGANMLMPNLSHLKELARILSAKARLEAQASNPDSAWDMANTQLRFADSTKTEPILISQLVRVASIRLSCKTIRELCEIVPPNEQQYSSIQELLASYDDKTPMIRAIDGERILFGEWAFNMLKDGSIRELSASIDPSWGSGIGEVLLSIYSAFKPLSLADQAAYMRLMHKSIKIIEDPYSHENANIIEKEAEEHYYLFTRMLIPAMFRIKEIHCEMTAELRITQAGMALLQHKQSRDAFPDKLEALKLQNINDPFSEQPIRYKPQGQGFILYSIGPDQKDNGGSPRQTKQKDDWDIVWVYTGEH
jgi:hypothetical protein